MLRHWPTSGSRGLFTPRQVSELLAPELFSGLHQPLPNPFDGWPSGNHNAAKIGDPVHINMLLESRRYLLNQLLRDSDVFGMSRALEIRVPLIDHRVAECVFSMSSQLLLAAPPKGVLRDALVRPLPVQCVDRPKRGFTFPLDTWMRGPLRQRLLDENPSGIFHLFRKDAQERLWRSFERGPDPLVKTLGLVCPQPLRGSMMPSMRSHKI